MPGDRPAPAPPRGARARGGAPRHLLHRLRAADRGLTRSAASWDGTLARRVLPVVEESVEHTKLWLAAASLMAAAGGPRGRRAAAAGLAGMWTAQAVGAGAKQLWRRPRPPRELIPHDRVEDRPDSSSFPSGHTVAAAGFTGAVAASWPPAGVPCAAVALAVAFERVNSGAHYPSDVVAGAAVGLAGARLGRRMLRRRGTGRRRRGIPGRW